MEVIPIHGAMDKPTATATGLTAGTYTVTAKDSKNCEITKTIEVIQPSNPNCNN